ncbi:probable ADP-ribosylation factor GTPase-activating protein agd13 [Phtheirospermum japonicum]|uniref:Probable ADP-ribosylation factor GTPase-activating protein agd13 n=1 Tax=Phtheirospermum japonicum TaxID=374723 RepID=A0A830BXD7_9LAMI|nr:probable ADP-ribosylation factor GTPase-activating protein agd13 [Phtheirospermum japonicum]
MENVSGLLKITVVRGIKLAVRDARSSDPYVIVRMGKQKLKTRVVKNNVNPHWNEELTLTVADPNLPIKLQVYDHDTFTPDDKMGDAEIEIKEFMEAVKLNLENVPSGTVISKVRPSRENCLCEESCIIWENGKVTQFMFVRLKNVECGEMELKLQWIHLSASRVL